MSRSGSVYFRTRNMSRFGRTLLTSLITVVSVAVAVSLFVVWRAVDDPPRSPAGIKRLSDGIFVADDEIGFRVRPNLSVVREINGRRTAVNTGPMGERTDGSTVEDVSSVGELVIEAVSRLLVSEIGTVVEEDRSRHEQACARRRQCAAEKLKASLFKPNLDRGSNGHQHREVRPSSRGRQRRGGGNRGGGSRGEGSRRGGHSHRRGGHPCRQ